MNQIVGSTALCYSFRPDEPVIVITNIFAQPPNDPQSIPICGERVHWQCYIQIANDKYTNILCYNPTYTQSYKFIRIATSSTAANPASDNSSTVSISTVCTHNIENGRRNWIRPYFIDEDRILVDNWDVIEDHAAGNPSTNRNYLSLFSLSAGLLWDIERPMYTICSMIIIPEHSLCSFTYYGIPQIIVVSLIDGAILRKIDIEGPSLDLTLYRVIDSLIVIKSANKDYYVINVLTGNVSVRPLPIPGTTRCHFLLDRMVAWNDKEMQVVCFAPESLHQ